MKSEIIRFKGISKRFGGTLALDNVSFSINRGEVHALVGENGAGKSTLVKVLAGVHILEKGTILINGKSVSISTPQLSKKNGISIVYQEMNLFPQLTVRENIFIGREKTFPFGFLQKRQMYNECKGLLQKLFHDIDAGKNIEELSIGERQIVEIARGLSDDSEIIILDEPNSALNETESQKLFDIINRLRERGITIIYVSHRLDEVFALADRLTVLRDGKYIETLNIEETTIPEVVSKMVGREINDVYPKVQTVSKDTKPILDVRNLSSERVLQRIDFEVRPGEIVGFAGLEGCGISELFNILFGLDKADGGEIWYKNKKIKKLTPVNAMNIGWGYIPPERREQGLMMNWSLLENISLPTIRTFVNKIGLISHRKRRMLANKYIKELDIKTDSMQKTVDFLSGGNQQKTVMAKWLSTQPELLILNDPTRGIDVGSKADIYSLINRLAALGLGILLTSSELGEIIGLSNRIYVVYKGEVIKTVESESTEMSDLRVFVGGETH